MNGQNGKIIATVETVTPAKALRMLERNNTNRAVMQSHVAFLARQMSEGQWVMTGEPIAFDVNGDLSGGQHRLWAVVESGKTIDLLVVRGVPADAQEKSDQVYARTAANTLELIGHDGRTSTTAAALKYLWFYVRYGVVRKQGVRPSNSEVRSLYEAHTQIDQSVVLTEGGRTKRIAGPHSMWAFSHYVFSRQDAEGADQFIRESVDGLGLRDGSITHVLRSRLEREAAAQRSIRADMVGWLIFRAWAAFVGAESLTRLQLPAEGTTAALYDIGRVPGIR